MTNNNTNNSTAIDILCSNQTIGGFSYIFKCLEIILPYSIFSTIGIIIGLVGINE